MTPHHSWHLQIFEEFYRINTSGRKLTWIFTNGEVVLNAIYAKKKYLIELTPLQAVILLLFNSPHPTTTSPSTSPVLLSYKQLKMMSCAPADMFQQVLHSLICGKVKLLSRNENKNSAISPSDVFYCNDSFRWEYCSTNDLDYKDSFRSKVTRIKVPMPQIKMNCSGSDLVNNRSYEIEASIVRIMKARKILSQSVLISEVRGRLRLFQPTPEVRDIPVSLHSLPDPSFTDDWKTHRSINQTRVFGAWWCKYVSLCRLVLECRLDLNEFFELASDRARNL